MVQVGRRVLCGMCRPVDFLGIAFLIVETIIRMEKKTSTT
jgi:hypothetical protein